MGDLEVGERLLLAPGSREREPEHPPGAETVGRRVAAELGERAVVAGRLPLVTSVTSATSSPRRAVGQLGSAWRASPASSAVAASRVSCRSSNASTSSAGTPSR